MDRLSNGFSRRAFLKTAGAVAGYAVLSSRAGARPPSDKLRVAQVGVGGRGEQNLQALIRVPNVEMAAICDVDRLALDKASTLAPQAERFADYRRLFDRMHGAIDAVLVSTPDHMHAPISMAAMDLGKHVYCEKPLAHSVWENRQLALKAEETGVVTQLGIQVSASIAQRMTVDYIRSGLIGKVSEVHVWSNKQWGLTEPALPEPTPPPDTLDWNLWLGIANERPYREGVYHPMEWRRMLDFGTGTLGDMGVHIFDTPYRALKLSAPLWARSACRPFNGLSHPESVQVEYAFGPTRYTTRRLKWFWYDGAYTPRTNIVGVDLPPDTELPEQGCLMVGKKGMLLLPHLSGPQTFPNELIRSVPKPQPEPLDHHGQWVSACLGEGKPGSPFAYGGPLCEALQLGVLANHFPGRALEWDASDLRVTNIAEANQYLRRDYRSF